MDHVLNEWRRKTSPEVGKSPPHRRVTAKSFPGRGILNPLSSTRPIFVPHSAIPSWASDFALHKIRRQQEAPAAAFRSFEDFEKFADTMLPLSAWGF